jgi:flagellin-like protein
MNRTGISPLIATVLLLAFAVAIGTMVVSYLLDAAQSTPCDDVAIALEGDASACYTDGHISFILVNKGDTPLSGAKVRLINTAGDISETRLGITLEPASATRAEIPYTTLNPEGVSMTLVPAIQLEKELFCAEQEIKVQLRQC